MIGLDGNDGDETKYGTSGITLSNIFLSTGTPTLGEDGKVPLKADNTSTLITAGRTLAVTNGVASLTGINSYNDGIAITFKLPDGAKLQDYTSVKLSMGASKAVYSKNIHVCVNQDDLSTPSTANGAGLHSQTKIGELTEKNVTTTASEFEIPLDFTKSYSGGDIEGTFCLMIGLDGNDGDETKYGASGITLSNIILA